MPEGSKRQTGLPSSCSTRLCLGLDARSAPVSHSSAAGGGRLARQDQRGNWGSPGIFKLYILMLWNPSFQSVPRSVRDPGRRQVT